MLQFKRLSYITGSVCVKNVNNIKPLLERMYIPIVPHCYLKGIYSPHGFEINVIDNRIKLRIVIYILLN